MSKSCSRKKINKTRYDDPRKSIKQTSFIVKNLGGNLPEKHSIIVKRSFRSSTKLLSLDSTIPVDKLTVETFYRFRTFELFNIWTPPFLMHESQYVTNSFARIPVRDSLTNLRKKNVGCKFLHFINNEDQEALGYKTLRRKDVVTSFWENKASVTFFIHSTCILLCDGLQNKPYIGPGLWEKKPYTNT